MPHELELHRAGTVVEFFLKCSQFEEVLYPKHVCRKPPSIIHLEIQIQRHEFVALRFVLFFLHQDISSLHSFDSLNCIDNEAAGYDLLNY